MREEKNLHSIYYSNLETVDKKENIVLLEVSQQTDEVEKVITYPFAIGQTKYFFEKYNEQGMSELIYWRFTRIKPLMFDIKKVSIFGIDYDFVYNIDQGQSDIFTSTYKPLFEKTKRRGLNFESYVEGIFKTGQIIVRLLDQEKTEQKVLSVTKKFFFQVLFSMPSENDVPSDQELIEKYDLLNFL